MLRKTCGPVARGLWRSCYQPRTARYSTVASRESTGSSDAVPQSVTDLSKPVHTQSPKRNPFVKSMFLGTVDTELLSFPESLNREEQSRLEGHKEQLAKVVDAAEHDPQTNSIALYGLQGPLEHTGKRFTETELAYVSELVAGDRSKAMVMLEHNTIVKLLSQYATDEAKERYLPTLCTGGTVAACAMYEMDSSRHSIFNTYVTQDFTAGTWTLNGSKVILRNDDTEPGLLLVIASTNRTNLPDKATPTVGAFLVDTRAPGVKMSHTPLGAKGLSRITVDFNHVELTRSDVVGAEHGGAALLSKFLMASRLQSSVVRVALLKKVLNALTEFCINAKTSTGEMIDIEIVRDQLARMTNVIYAAESMIYMTASLIDDFEDQDAEVEAAITKVFTSGSLLDFATLPFQLLGSQALANKGDFEALFNDSLQLFIGDESSDSVNFFIALGGLQYTGMHYHETIRKDRNPAMNPSHVLAKLFEKTSIENPKKFADLNQFFHPSLEPAAHWIECSVVRLKLATECVLSRHGIEVIDRHIELTRLAKIATSLYAMTAAASRASRSYCIGLRHAAHEVHLANMFCRERSETVRLLALELEKGPFATSDDDNSAIARQLFREKQYFFEHPLKRNF